jgi:uncharacterized Zn finger protein (UPF0148 family)
MTTCPNCGHELPQEEGQHALSPSAGTIECPNCGATVTLEGPPGAEGGPPREGPADQGEPVTTAAALEETDHQDYFSGEETLAGVMEELEEKPGGPDGGER